MMRLFSFFDRLKRFSLVMTVVLDGPDKERESLFFSFGTSVFLSNCGCSDKDIFYFITDGDLRQVGRAEKEKSRKEEECLSFF